MESLPTATVVAVNEEAIFVLAFLMDALTSSDTRDLAFKHWLLGYASQDQDAICSMILLCPEDRSRRLRIAANLLGHRSLPWF